MGSAYSPPNCTTIRCATCAPNCERPYDGRFDYCVYIKKEPYFLATPPSPEDLIVSPPARPIPRPRLIKPTTQHTSSSSSAHVPSAPTLPPARALTPTDFLLKPASVSTVSHTVVSKKRPSAEFLADSDSPLTDAESVAPSPAKRPKPGKRGKAGQSSKSAGKKRKGRKLHVPQERRIHWLYLSSALMLLSVAVRTPSLADFHLYCCRVIVPFRTFLVTRRPRVLIMHVVDFCNARHVVLK